MNKSLFLILTLILAGVYFFVGLAYFCFVLEEDRCVDRSHFLKFCTRFDVRAGVGVLSGGERRGCVRSCHGFCARDRDGSARGGFGLPGDTVLADRRRDALAGCLF
jgi:hypothetical protein